MCVDDILAGSHCFVQATRNRDEIIHIMNSAGFFPRKRSSNDKGFIEVYRLVDTDQHYPNGYFGRNLHPTSFAFTVLYNPGKGRLKFLYLMC